MHNSAQAFLSLWAHDRDHALLVLYRMAAKDCLALMRAVAEHQGCTVEQVFDTWREAIEEAGHSTHPAITTALSNYTRH